MSNIVSSTDQELISLIAADNEDALEGLFERYFYRLCAYTISLVQSKEVAEEIVADVFVMLWQKRKTLRITANVRSYLFAIVRNRAFSMLSKRKVIIPLEDLQATEQPLSLPADAAIIYDDFREELYALLEKLPEQQRLILKMNRLEGYTPNEIASLLNLSPKTVYAHLSGAIEFLMKYQQTITVASLLVIGRTLPA